MLKILIFIFIVNTAQNITNITSIELKHTNQSLGPYEKIVILTLPINVQTENRLFEFLGLSIINGVVQLKEYLKAKRNCNIEVINKVEQK